MTAPAAGSAVWLGLDPADGGVDERHLEHEVLHLLHDLELPADLVGTHLVLVDGRTQVAASARLTGVDDVLDPGVLARLRAAWSGGLVLESAGDEPSLEAGARAGRAGARQAVEQARAGTSGRAVRFPGQSSLVDPLPVGDVPLVSAVAAVVPVVGEVEPGTVLDPRGHVRPRWADGRLVLLVRPGTGGTVVPVEKLTEHACAGH